MKVLALTCTHGRSETVDIFLHHLDYHSVIIDSTPNNEYYYAKLRHRNHDLYFHENEPLGEKWNFGLSMCKNIDFDYLLITGSDDLFSPGLIDFLVNKKVHYAGFLDFYFYDTERDLAKYCPGMRYNRKGEPHGAGRILHRSVLESLNWVLWDDKLNSGLDASMTKRLKTLEITTWFGNIPTGMYAVDLKTSDNIHRIEEYPGVMMTNHEKAELLNHFSLQYV